MIGYGYLQRRTFFMLPQTGVNPRFQEQFEQLTFSSSSSSFSVSPLSTRNYGRQPLGGVVPTVLSHGSESESKQNMWFFTTISQDPNLVSSNSHSQLAGYD